MTRYHILEQYGNQITEVLNATEADSRWPAENVIDAVDSLLFQHPGLRGRRFYVIPQHRFHIVDVPINEGPPKAADRPYVD